MMEETKNINVSASRRVPLPVAAGIVVLLLFLYVFRFYFKRDGFFEDSLMFYRYALHIREGLGVSWNFDRVPTYGATSLLWQFCILVFSFLPFPPRAVVMTASLLFFVASLGVMAKFIWSNARSSALRDPGTAVLVVSLPLVLNYGFLLNAQNGMDTMLALGLNALLVTAAMRFAEAPTNLRALLLAGLGLLIFEARPEMVVCAILLPVLLSIVSERRVRVSSVLLFLAVLAGLVGCAMLLCRKYFGTPVPLAFYLKSRGGYVGYTGYAGPYAFLLDFLGTAAPFLLLFCISVRRADIRFLTAFALPVLAVVLYLCTVTQIMGDAGRYFAPLLPFIALPSILIADRRLREPTRWYFSPVWPRALAVLLIVLGSSAICGGDIVGRASMKYVLRHNHPVPSSSLVMKARQPLPELGWGASILAVTEEIAHTMPPGTGIAATEVGYLGAYSPKVNVIDLSGLNDREFAFHGFSMDALLRKAPDAIWMPNPNYTGMVESMISDPRFLQQYTLYAGAFDYGFAIRKDSSIRQQLEHSLAVSWASHYPAKVMDEYRVTAVVPPHAS